MQAFYLDIVSALWLGILTSISPCPLATNIAAISYIGRQVDRPRRVLLSGLLYTFGRVFTYVTLGIILVAGILSVPEAALFLQRYMNKILGPMLVIVGLILIDVIRFNLPGLVRGDRLQQRFERSGVWGAAFLGSLFALSFCPISAALFFGSLIPLAVEQESRVLMPTAYGIGTALPVVGFALLIALGTRLVGVVFNRLTKLEFWFRRLTGIIFILIGLYYLAVYWLHLQLW